MSRTLKLTTIGLPICKELLAKSQLRIVGAGTVDQWLFCDDIDAHVAVCNPDSAMTAVLLKQSQRTGMPRCVALTREDTETALNTFYTLRDPIRVSALIELLNAIFAELLFAVGDADSADAPKKINGHRVADDGAIVVAPHSECFGLRLQELIGRASHDVHCVEVADVTLHVIPSARALLSKTPPTEQVLSLRGQLLSTLPGEAQFALRRWPDFGRLKHQPGHIRMAAHLVRPFALSSGEYTRAGKIAVP